MKTFNEILNESVLNEKKDLSKYSDILSKLTDKNDHMTARLLMAELVGDKRLIEIVKGINNIIDYEKNNPISDYTYRIYTKLNVLGRKKYGEDEWNKNIYQNM